MEIRYIISQIFEILALIITLLAYHRKTKDKMFKQMLFANFFDILHYFFLNVYSGFITKVIALLRNFTIVKKEKYKFLNKKIWLYFFILAYIISATFTYKSIFSLLPLIAAIIYMSVSWDGNELQIKRTGFYCYFLWLTYNISVFSIAGIISNIVSLISTYVAYKNEKRIK